MKNYFYILVLHLFLQAHLNAQMIPCIDGTAGPYPCDNYDLMSNTNTETLSGNISGMGSDIWGWTDPSTNKEYAIVGMTNTTAFVDVSDPENPILLGRLSSHNGRTSPWRDMKVYKNFVFIVADNVGSHGMQVFDLTRLRNVTSIQNFTADTRLTGVDSCHNIVINESEGVAYLVGCNTFSGGPTFIDISNPLNPTILGGYSTRGYSHDAQVVTYKGPDSDYTGREIYVGSNGNSDRVVILDVTDKSNVTTIASFTYPQISYAHQGWFTEDQRYFILGDETDEQGFGFNTKTLVFDFNDLDNPILSSNYFGTTKAIDHNGYVKGNEYFIANYRAGMRVLDLTNIGAPTESMTEIGYFDTYPESDSAAFNGAWSIYPYFASGNIIISDIERGLFVVKQSTTLSTSNIELHNVFTLSPNPTNLNATITASNKSKIKSIEIFSILGKNLFKKLEINKKSFKLPVAGFSKGVYLVKINNSITKKLVIE